MVAGASEALWIEEPVVMSPYADDRKQQPLWPTEDPLCNELVAHRWPSVRHLGDVTKLDGCDVPEDVDLVVGGFPCQDLSGLNTTRRGEIFCSSRVQLADGVTAVKRGAFARKGPGFSDYATVIRCARRDQTSLTVRVIYLTDGSAVLSFTCVGRKVLMDYVLVHLERPHDKCNLLIYMLQKLYAVVDGTAQEDNVDTLQHHDLLLPGHLLTMFVKERFQEFLGKVKVQAEKELKEKAAKTDVRDVGVLKRCIDKVPSSIGKRVEYFLNTGNLVSESGLDLQQAAGFTVVAEKLNFLRYLSHFRSVHRGAYFQELRTTTVRKLLPESWGFLCPVHTPDGSPCGLLMHLTRPCLVTADLDATGKPKDPELLSRSISSALLPLGFQPVTTTALPPAPPLHLSVVLDGCIIGYLEASTAPAAVAHLRRLKTPDEGDSGIPGDLEVAFIPPSVMGTFPGLFLFSSPARMMRPVRRIGAPAAHGPPPVELIGALEQAYMEIRCPDGGQGGRETEDVPGVSPATHEEIHPTSMLSVVASLTPWSDYNQSPRNMYQCQMGKQTMGVPMQAFPHRVDNKFYRLQTPQTPIARTEAFKEYHMDDFPTGTNAVVAVLAYTGCTEVVDLTELQKQKKVTGGDRISKLKGVEAAVVDHVSLIGTGPKEPLQKFSSRHGQKGVLSQLWPDVDMPFCDNTGMRPDIIINPHAFPSRMTIGMLVESMASKAGALTGRFVNATTFREAAANPSPLLFPANGTTPAQHPHSADPTNTGNADEDHTRRRGGQDLGSGHSSSKSINGRDGRREKGQKDGEVNGHARGRGAREGPPTGTGDDGRGGKKEAGAAGTGTTTKQKKTKKATVVDEFGRQLVSSGFSYYGTETMYSGVLGTEMPCHIFIGVVYYQRLRHMVSDKFQVRSTGPVNTLTQQPVKGRKFGGGIRFGEMERDALLSHGAAYLLHDRLHSCSDYHTTHVCSKCGSLLGAEIVPQTGDTAATLGLGLGASGDTSRKKVVACRVCRTAAGVESVAMPYVFKYLSAELAAMNIKLSLSVGDA
eukprot:jgi/Mesen1/6093/ME000031S05363